MNEAVRYEDNLLEELINGEIVAMSPRRTWNPISIPGYLYHVCKSYLSWKSCTPYRKSGV